VHFRFNTFFALIQAPALQRKCGNVRRGRWTLTLFDESKVLQNFLPIVFFEILVCRLPGYLRHKKKRIGLQKQDHVGEPHIRFRVSHDLAGVSETRADFFRCFRECQFFRVRAFPESLRADEFAKDFFVEVQQFFLDVSRNRKPPHAERHGRAVAALPPTVDEPGLFIVAVGIIFYHRVFWQSLCLYP